MKGSEAFSGLDGILTPTKNINNGADGCSRWAATPDWFWKDKPQCCDVPILVARQETSRFSHLDKLEKNELLNEHLL